MNSIPESTKLAGDGLAVFAWSSALAGILTNYVGLLAAVASLVWACIRIYETKTVQKWVKG